MFDRSYAPSAHRTSIEQEQDFDYLAREIKKPRHTHTKTVLIVNNPAHRDRE